MPTGYTHAVKDGKINTLNEYAWSCARAFGALISMRDDTTDTPIPDRLEPDTSYYDERISEAEILLSEIPQLSVDECDDRAEAEYRERLERHIEYVGSKADSKRRYEAMLAKVNAWAAHDDLAGLKSFMAEQLTGSIEFDCGGRDIEPPVRLAGEAWRATTLEKASRDLAYNTTERDKEIARVADRNRWLDELRKAVGEPFADAPVPRQENDDG